MTLAASDQADEDLANSLAAYLRYTDSRLGGRQQLDGTSRGEIAMLAAAAAEMFAVAHEYGHFLAGHLDQLRPTGSEWLRKGQEQEYEADEIGMLLALQVQKTNGGVPICCSATSRGCVKRAALAHSRW